MCRKRLFADGNAAYSGRMRGWMKQLKRMAALMLLFMMCLISAVPANAAGSGNVDGGGGSLSHGKDGYYWPDVGYDGVRVTVVDAQSGQRVSVPVDYTNVDVGGLSSTICHFGKVCKMDYRNGVGLSPQVGGYVCRKPAAPIPQIISGNSRKASIPAIRQYFCSEAAAVMVANDTGIPFGDIEQGKYKLVIEPIIYLVYQHLYFAMTTTEAGLYCQMTGGDLSYHFPTVVMQNHALALFLERDDLGFAAWTGPRGSARTAQEMVSILGIGIISYKKAPETVVNYDQVYRVDTDVIIAVRLSAGGKKTPDDPAWARFTVGGRTYSHNNIYIPENGSQLAWVKWHTPSEPGEVTIAISSNCGTSTGQIRALIVDMDDNPPPDPQADDRNDGFSIPSAPGKQNVTYLTWGEWDCWWHAHWVWHSDIDEDGADNGYWCDHGWWEYAWKSYSASLSAVFATKPDAKNPTASGKTMKSGYGLNAEAYARVSSSAPSGHITGAQNVVAYFPEFDYGEYWRLLKRKDSGYSSSFEFQVNPYSTYGRPVHFSPVWYPNGRYATYVEVLDAWTPAGMLQINLTDALTVRGSLYDDWHICPIK